MIASTETIAADFEREALSAAAHEHAQARTEIRLLACICPLRRRGVAVARQAGVTLAHFQQPDAATIFGALMAADDAGTIGDNGATFQAVGDALDEAGLWDAADTRSFASGMRWAPASLAALFSRVPADEAGRMLPILAHRLAEPNGNGVAADLAWADAPFHPRGWTPTAKGEQAADNADGPIVTCMADVEPREVSWSWPGRVPLGRISLVIGRPGEGKSFFTTDVAARVSTGTPWPDGSPCERGSVLIISGEDDPADTIRPRLDAHHADVSRVHLLSMVRWIGENGKPHDVMFTLADVGSLETTLKRLGDCKLVIVDPIGSFIGGSTDAHRDNEVRAVLAPVAKLAEKYGPAVLVVAHRRKGGGNVADDLAMGSRAFTGIARACWHLSRDAQDKRRRLLLPGKNNLAVEGDGLAFTIAGDPPALCWERDPVRMSADDALAIENGGDDESKPGPAPVVRNMAAEWLRGELADLQEHAVAVLKDAAESAGVGSWKSVQRAAQEIGVITHRGTFGGGYVWRLPKPAPLQDSLQDTGLREKGTCPPVLQGENTGKTHVFAGQVPLQDRIISLVPQGENMSNKDADQLAACKDTIDGFIKANNALAEIRNKRLYRDTDPTFEAYCRRCWNLTDEQIALIGRAGA